MSVLEPPSWIVRHSLGVWVGAAVAGPLVAGLLTPFRGSLDPVHVALVLVLVVAAVSALGRRPAGVLAAVTTGLGFDFFWTQPYGSLAVGNASDIATVLLLVAVGTAIEQLSWWAQRQHAEADRRLSYLRTLRLASGTAAPGEGASQLEAACAALTGMLDADRSRFVLGAGDGATTLLLDGSVTRDGVVLPVDRDGLPTDDILTLPVTTELGQPAHFAITASSHVARPTVEQRHVAALVATLTVAQLPAARTAVAESSP
ncbi:DUF4118 domain-containing protein [uncultured Friedmanniella sp.]|uniref:DUF4118 domain-containing protein n=1 Tax=uncultured Friedmanniella sp. TaxID=335381 RepID=UPI0035CBB937